MEDYSYVKNIVAAYRGNGPLPATRGMEWRWPKIKRKPKEKPK